MKLTPQILNNNPAKLYIKQSHSKAILLLKLCSLYLLFTSIFSAKVFCGTLDTNALPVPTFLELLADMHEDDLVLINQEFDTNLIRNVVIAIGINMVIIGLIWYGPTIYDYARDTLGEITQHAWRFFAETARETAARRFANADPETQAAMYHTAQALIQARIGGHMPPAA